MTLDTLIVTVDWSQFTIYSIVGGAYELEQCFDWLYKGADDTGCQLLVHSSMSELYLTTEGE